MTSGREGRCGGRVLRTEWAWTKVAAWVGATFRLAGGKRETRHSVGLATLMMLPSAVLQ
jgi:hypothetical protein